MLSETNSVGDKIQPKKFFPPTTGKKILGLNFVSDCILSRTEFVLDFQRAFLSCLGPFDALNILSLNVTSIFMSQSKLKVSIHCQVGELFFTVFLLIELSNESNNQSIVLHLICLGLLVLGPCSYLGNMDLGCWVSSLLFK